MTARAFAGSRPRIAKSIHAFIILLMILFLPIQVCKMVICTPLQAFWDDSIQDETCLNQGILYMCDTTIAMVSDLAILGLPIYLTWSLSVKIEKKLKISILLGAGGIAVGLTAYRLYKTWMYTNTKDLTVDVVAIITLSYVKIALGPLASTEATKEEESVTTDMQYRTGELSIGIVCACLPSVNLLLERRASKKCLYQNDSSDITTKDKHRPKSSSKFSSWITSKRSTTTTHTPTTWEQSTTGPNHTTVYQVDIDVELGTITEIAGEDDMDIIRGQGRSGRTRVMSMDGRREGWLAPSTGQQKKNNKNHDPKTGLPTSSSEVVFVGESNIPPWDFIWDGRRTAFTDTRLQELKHERPP